MQPWFRQGQEYDSKEVQALQVGADLYLQCAKDWHIPLGQMSWAKQVNEKEGMTPSVISNTRNLAGLTLLTLVVQSGSGHIVQGIEQIVGQQPFEVFAGKLVQFYSGIGNKEALEYATELSEYRNPNLSSEKRMPILFYICHSYIGGTRSPYQTVTLLEEFLWLPDVNINVCNTRGEYIFDIFDTGVELNEHHRLVTLLLEHGANPNLSEKWTLDAKGNFQKKLQIADNLTVEEIVPETISYRDTPLPVDPEPQTSFFKELKAANTEILQDVWGFFSRLWDSATRFYQWKMGFPGIRK